MSSSKLSSAFLFTVCQVGAEPVLKNEIQKLYPFLRFSYSRPGFITFKASEKSSDGASKEKKLTPGFDLKSFFARAYGIALGRKKSPEEILATVREIHSGKPLRLHVWETDLYSPGKEPPGWENSQRVAAELRSQLLSADADEEFFLREAKAQGKDLVIDVICLPKGEFWLGIHQHSHSHSPFPGGKPPIVLPGNTPSRAYLKIEEAIENLGIMLEPGDTAVEIGSAPGGATFALLRRGLNVAGIDPGEMAPQVHAFGPERFQHIQKPVASVMRDELPRSIEWILLDMNSEPRLAFPPVERLAGETRKTLLGVFLTLKLNQWQLAEKLPGFLARAQKMGMARVFCRQLAANAREISLVGLTRKGLERQKAN